jgi:hypothetical protein
MAEWHKLLGLRRRQYALDAFVAELDATTRKKPSTSTTT